MREIVFWRVLQLFGLCIISYLAYGDSFFVMFLFFISIFLYVDANMKEDRYEIEHEKSEYQNLIIYDLRSRLKPYLRGKK